MTERDPSTTPPVRTDNRVSTQENLRERLRRAGFTSSLKALDRESVERLIEDLVVLLNSSDVEIARLKQALQDAEGCSCAYCPAHAKFFSEWFKADPRPQCIVCLALAPPANTKAVKHG